MSWNAPFKTRLRAYYDQWMVEGDHPTTAGGNPKPPPPEVYLQWIIDAWEAVTKDTIINSFRACGITTAMDGSEDHHIHCLKEGNGIPNGLYSLATAREEADASQLADDLRGLEVEVDEDDAGNFSDASVIDDENPDEYNSDDSTE